jgi:hypothetical protein
MGFRFFNLAGSHLAKLIRGQPFKAGIEHK